MTNVWLNDKLLTQLSYMSLNACLNRYVFKCFLNISMSLVAFNSSVREFHNVGAATLNDLFVNVLHFVLGISRRSSLLDLSPSLVGLSLTVKFLRYCGPWSFRHLRVSTRILKFIQNRIGSQCR